MDRAPGGDSIWELWEQGGYRDLAAAVHELTLWSHRQAFTELSGGYRTRIRGSGLDFHEARKYVYGESIRQIDWNMTARMGEPYVRVYNEERERSIIICLDGSPSMHTGWQDRRKIEFAVEIAASIAAAAVAARDRLGLCIYSDSVTEYLNPGHGAVQLYKVLAACFRCAVAKPRAARISDMRLAVHRVQRNRGKRFMIFFLSDFIDHDIPDDLKYLQAKHDVTLIQIYDPFEYHGGADIALPGVSPEGKRRMVTVPAGTAADFTGDRDGIAAASAELGVRFETVSTNEPVSATLRRLFRHGPGVSR